MLTMIGAIATFVATFKTIQTVIAIINGVKAAMIALNATLMANPITLIVAGIVAVAIINNSSDEPNFIFKNVTNNGDIRIGSTTGGLVLYCACAMERQPACMLFANHIDSLAAAGAILADVWLDNISMPVVDCLGDEFLEYVKDGMKVTIKEDGVVVVE